MRKLIPVATLVMGIAIGAAVATPAIDHTNVPVWQIAAALYTPCATADSQDCYRDGYLSIAGHVFYAPLTPQ